MSLLTPTPGVNRSMRAGAIPVGPAIAVGAYLTGRHSTYARHVLVTGLLPFASEALLPCPGASVIRSPRGAR
jgi:hypothetical protein